MTFKLQETNLWKLFEKKANNNKEQIVLVEKFVKKATERLILVRDTFPTYTLHNELHSLNVVKSMSDLLGDEIEKLTSLECALLVLSAYYHDIGMVFTPDEKLSLANEMEFGDFLKENPKAHLQLKQHQLIPEHKNDIPDVVAEWYCRWIHPQKSAKFVLTFDEINWDNYPVNKALSFVCKSHGFEIQDVYQWKEIEKDFLNEADLLFCSIILRLADILDFDNSRSPEQVYQYLKLSERKTKKEQISDIEWRKHLCTKGFSFSTNNRTERYPIKFISAPDEPAVEHDVREFLTIIEREFDKCNTILKYCSKKYENFKLPLSIDKNNILSKGYTYGDYRFSLEKEQILNLLMGENLYSDPYVFIRELVQNAIDTTRFRVEYEKNNGKPDYQSNPIEFTSWTDFDGYTWVRIDDYGMGMDEHIITEYFLKVGKSYYTSDEFKLEQITLRTNFLPISRFGIGVLSCFIVGNQIELNTRRVVPTPKRNALRMSMQGLNAFYIFKKEEEQHPCINMPNRNKQNEEYRKPSEYGTSIAVRLNPKVDRGDFNLEKLLNEYIIASPIPIKLNGELVGADS